MARDIYHEHVKEALIKDGWTVTHDPYLFRHCKSCTFRN
jgi:XisH protein